MQNYEILGYILPFNLGVIGLVYQAKGELDLALKYHNESLDHSEGNYLILKLINAASYNNIGEIYFQKGNPSQTLEYYEKSLKICEQFSTPLGHIWVGINYNSLISAFLYKKLKEKAQETFDRFLNWLEREKIPESFYWYRLTKAKVLRSSSRIRNRAEAERILQELIKGHDVLVKSGARGIAEEFTIAMIELCDFYVEELQLTHDLEVLEDIEPYIERLLKESERTKSYSQQAHTRLLQGQLALLQINMGDARRYLTQAQRIAEEHNLQLLARMISREHDKLLEQLNKWESLKGKESSISERMDLTSLDITMDRMQGMRAIDPPELIDETPILLLIIGQDGISYFNHSFTENWDYNDLFSSFMSAFNTFSAEIFSESIDRIKIGENLILIKPIEPFLVCYVIKGQSYPALLKLTRFSDAIKWKSEIWDALNKVVKTSEILELHKPPSLGDVVNEIFNVNFKV
jgi:tetratricopeptide (TPR) repeat protein